EEERDARRPHGDSGAKGGETAANDGGRRAERREEDERVGELEGRRPERDRRLEPHVQEDDGQRQREDGRACGDVAGEHEASVVGAVRAPHYTGAQMEGSVLRRRAGAAVGTYASIALGFLATLV